MKLGLRLVAAAGVLALASGLAVTTGPAHAATATVQTTTTVTVKDYSADGSKIHYGDYLSVNATAVGADGKNPIYGTMSIQTAPLGSSTWTTVATESFPSAYYSIDGIRSGLQVRAVYSGTAGDPDFDATYDTPYAGSTSAVYSTGSLGRGEAVASQTKHKVCYRVGPAAYKNKPITYYVKLGKSKKWRFDGVIRTNKKSEYCYKIHKTKVKKHVKYKGPKIKAFKTVYVASGGMKKEVQITKY